MRMMLECAEAMAFSGSAAKLDDAAPFALAWPALRQWRILLHRFALFGYFDPRFLAGFRFPIKCLGHGRWTAHLTQPEDLNFKFAAFIPYVKHVADPNFAS
jgi:hypothetical protein